MTTDAHNHPKAGNTTDNQDVIRPSACSRGSEQMPAHESAPAVTSRRKAANWFSGETLTFRRTSVETAGELVELDLELRPLGAPGGLPHRHVVAEHFEFAHGAVCAFIAGRRPRIVRAGEMIDVPPNRWHYIVALRRTGALVRIRPAMHFDELLVVWAAIGRGDLRPATLRRLVPLLREHGCI